MCTQLSSCFVARHQTSSPNLWLLNISDFSPVDYRILAMRQEWVCHYPMWDADKLKKRLIDRQMIIDQAIDRWSWGHKLWPEVDIWNSWHSPLLYCCTVLLVHTFSYFYDVSFKCWIRYWLCLSLCGIIKILFKIFKRDEWFWYHFVPTLRQYKCAKNYQNGASFDIVIVKIKWCSFWLAVYMQYDAKCEWSLLVERATELWWVY